MPAHSWAALIVIGFIAAKGLGRFKRLRRRGTGGKPDAPGSGAAGWGLTLARSHKKWDCHLYRRQHGGCTRSCG